MKPCCILTVPLGHGFCTSDGKDSENCCPRSDLVVHILGLAHSGGHKSTGARGVWGDSPSGKFRIACVAIFVQKFLGRKGFDSCYTSHCKVADCRLLDCYLAVGCVTLVT